jgi:hypothetical protein
MIQHKWHQHPGTKEHPQKGQVAVGHVTSYKCHRFQVSKDKASTANLRHHAIHCFGEDAVKIAMSVKDVEAHSGSIFAAFAHQGQQLVQNSHRSLTNTEIQWALRFNTKYRSNHDI